MNWALKACCWASCSGVMPWVPERFGGATSPPSDVVMGMETGEVSCTSFSGFSSCCGAGLETGFLTLGFTLTVFLVIN